MGPLPLGCRAVEARHDSRHAMNQPFEGGAYEGYCLVADIAMAGPLPRDEAGGV